jgi:hypothetical protein
MHQSLPLRQASRCLPLCLASAVLAGMLLAVSMSTAAQSVLSGYQMDPLDPRAVVPAVVFVSSLSALKPTREDTLSWRQANDTVTRIGGWRVYTREAQQPDEPAAPAATPSTPAPGRAEMVQPKQHGHGNHKSMHHGHGVHPSPSGPTP